MEHTEPKSGNITWHTAAVTKEQRTERLGHRGAVLWFTGFSGAGKSTLANATSARLFALGAITYVLDGDNVRHGLNRDLGFSAADREENIRRIGEVAGLFADAGLIVCSAFISPYRRDRLQARESAAPLPFIEVYCRCPLAVCEARDPKGLYRKARAGEITDFTGISAPYEPPETAELALDTDQLTLNAAVDRVVEHLVAGGILRRQPIC